MGRTKVTIDGNEAAAYVAHKTNEVVALYHITVRQMRAGVPHSAIRAKLYDAAALNGAPESFLSAAARKTWVR